MEVPMRRNGNWIDLLFFCVALVGAGAGLYLHDWAALAGNLLMALMIVVIWYEAILLSLLLAIATTAVLGYATPAWVGVERIIAGVYAGLVFVVWLGWKFANRPRQSG
jgi:hypothetical protein